MAKKRDQPRGGPEAKEAWPIETELRLAGSPETLEALFSSPLLASDKGEDDRVNQLKSCYYDTVDQQLRAKGLALRVRADGAGHQQTLKAGDKAKALLLKRGEWNIDLESDRPDIEALPSEALKLLPKAARQDGLREAFATHVKRRTRKILANGKDQPAGRIEAALDIGEIKTGAGSTPIAELELELIEGSSEALYRLALDLQELGPLQLETRSKSSRAYDQLCDRPPSWHRAKTPPLRPKDTVDDAMAAIFASCFDQWLANQAAALDGRDPEGVHQMRVGLRRLRSALSVFRKLIPQDQFVWLKEDAKRTIGALGPARDWDVFQQDLLAPLLAARPQDPGLRALRTKARGRARIAYRAARRSFGQSDYTRFALRFGQWIEARGWRQGADDAMGQRQSAPIADFANHLLRKRYKRALSDGQAFEDLTVEQRHDLRIALKKLRYTAEFFQPLFGKKAIKPFLSSAKTLQDDLGHQHDVAVAEGLLKDLLTNAPKPELIKAAGLIIGWHTRGCQTVEASLLEDWRAFAQQQTFWT